MASRLPLPHALAHSMIFLAAASPLSFDPIPTRMPSAGISTRQRSGRCFLPRRASMEILSNSNGSPRSAALDLRISQLPNRTSRHTPRKHFSPAARSDISGPIPAGSPVVIPSCGRMVSCKSDTARQQAGATVEVFDIQGSRAFHLNGKVSIPDPLHQALDLHSAYTCT